MSDSYEAWQAAEQAAALVREYLDTLTPEQALTPQNPGQQPPYFAWATLARRARELRDRYEDE